MRYSKDFYQRRARAKVHAAGVVVDHLLELTGPLHSVADLGCGIGIWLKAFSERGVEELAGFDGPWLEDSALEMPREWFSRRNLGEPLSAGRRFDLAVSLEVAEHLPETQAGTFVKNLADLSDVVLFSAAVPGQGGSHHVNEQWPEYWRDRFANSGYELLDILRSHFWYDDSIPYWYRQNLLVFANPAGLERYPRLAAERSAGRSGPLSLVHPEMFRDKLVAGQRFWQKSAPIPLPGAGS